MYFEENLYTVSQLTKEIKQTLEEGFPQVSVIGEISNFKAHVSGHWYFNLKDADAVISVTMWKGINNYVFFSPQDGMKVIVNGRITVYPPRGNYQLDARSMKPAGVGELQAAMEKLKQKLAQEGLFDEQHKKPIPYMPMKIGIVTAPDGAAFRDMISVAERRFPIVELIIAPARVQGTGAAESIVRSLNMLNSSSDIDVIIVGRGGGSIEDLWAFNEELVARAIFDSKIPVVTGIGHEVDFTIADFAADLRAPTPSAAMEIITPDKADVFAFISDFSYNATDQIEQMCQNNFQEVIQIINSYGFRMPLDLLRRRSQQADSILYRINKNIDRKFLIEQNRLSLLSKSLESHDINKSLRKGFVLVKQDAAFVTRSNQFNFDKPASLKFFDNEITINAREN